VRACNGGVGRAKAPGGSASDSSGMTTATAWPELGLDSWAPTKKSLHAYAQMLGKLRLALAPHQPNFLFTSLAHTARGVTTGAMPNGLRTIEASIDVFSAQLVLASSNGGEYRISLAEPQTVAGVFAEIHAGLAALDVAVALSPIPQEVPDVTPFDTDERPAIFNPADAQRWLTVMAAINAVFDRWRAHFFGRTGIQLWWGAFDFALLLFNGNHIDAPTDRGYLIAYDLDAEMMNVGFYPGDDANPAMFYGYIYPQPAACRTMAPAGASWSDTLGEWVLPYDAVRTSADPEAMLVAFLDSIYDICGQSAGWDRQRLTYRAPPLRRARASS
jgi:hypothetical protein